MLIEEKLVSVLKEKGLTLATAESCTGGLLSKRITDVSGSSEVFNCGIVSYSNGIKNRILGVSEETLKNYGAVSENTVREMVRGVLKVSGDDIAVAVSGIAGPASDSTDKPVGLIYIAVSDGKETRVKELRNCFTENIRENNRNKAADTAFEMLIDLIG
ncbi:MAG: CinA family protein [Clostridiales bacterium]|nr:CinA family protein [Clostridiales bacterium]